MHCDTHKEVLQLKSSVIEEHTPLGVHPGRANKQTMLCRALSVCFFFGEPVLHANHLDVTPL